MELTTTQLMLLFTMSLGAAFVQRVSGFGFGIFIMTVLPYLMPSYGEATTLSGMLAMVTSVIIVIRHRKELKWNRLLPILVTFLVVSFFAIRFVSQAGGGLLRILLGCVLILASVWFLFLADRFKLPPTLPVQFSMGTLSGIMGGLFGMQGPPAVLYFVSASNTKEEYMAIAQMYFLTGNLMMTFYRAHYGFLTASVLQAWCYGIAAVLLGTWIGSWVFRYISLPLLRKIIYLYMAVSGIICLMS